RVLVLSRVESLGEMGVANSNLAAPRIRGQSRIQVLIRESDQRLSFFERYKPAEFAELVKVAAHLDADRLIDATDADGCKAGRSDQFGDGPACFRIIRRIEQRGTLRRTVRRSAQRLGTQSAESLDGFGALRQQHGVDLARGLIGGNCLLEAAFSVRSDRI